VLESGHPVHGACARTAEGRRVLRRKALSFVAGVGIILVVPAIARRMKAGPAGTAGGMALLIRTGPLAI
jgi:hypothetical protein